MVIISDDTQLAAADSVPSQSQALGNAIVRYLIIIIMLAIPSFALSAVEKPLFEFKVSGADCGNACKETTVETEYNGQDIATSVKFSINCAYLPHKPSYILKQDTVIFTFETFSPTGAIARCVCDTTVLFKLSLNSERHAGFYKSMKKRPLVKVRMDGKEIVP
jgi:hypothetical protein